LVAEVWDNGNERERQVADMLIAALESIGSNWTTWRAEQLTDEHPTAPAPKPTDSVAERPDVLEAALTLAEAAAGDGRQRAVS